MIGSFCADCPHDSRCLDQCYRLQKTDASYYAQPVAVVGGLERGQVRCGPCGAVYALGQRHGDCKITHPEDAK